MEKKTWIEYSRGLKWAGLAPKNVGPRFQLPSRPEKGKRIRAKTWRQKNVSERLKDRSRGPTPFLATPFLRKCLKSICAIRLAMTEIWLNPGSDLGRLF